MRRGSREHHRTLSAVAGCCAAAMWLCCLAGGVGADEPMTPAGSADPVRNPSNYEEASRSLEKAVDAERQSLERLREELRNLRASDPALEIEINAYKVQNSAHGNLLHVDSVPLEELEKALATSRASRERVEPILRQLRLQETEYDQILRQTRDHLQLNQKELGEIRALKDRDAVTESLLGKLSALTGTLSKKEKVLEEIQGFFASRIQREEGLVESLGSMSGKLETRVLEKRTKHLFLREESPLAILFKEGPEDEDPGLAAQRFRAFLSAGQWAERLQAFWQTEKAHLPPAVLFFGILHLLIHRFRRVCRRVQDRMAAAERPWTVLSLRLFRRSLPLLGTAVFLVGYAEIRNITSSDSLIRPAVEIMGIWLFTRWGLEFLRFRGLREKETMSPALVFRFRLLLHGVRVLATLFSVAKFAFLDYGYPLVLLRLLFEAGFVAWNVDFWRQVRSEPESFLNTPPLRGVKNLITGTAYLVPVGALVLDLTGYGALALFWLVSWGRTAGILFWGILSFLCLKEWDRRRKTGKMEEERLSPETRRPLVWLAARLLWLAWFGLVLALFFFAWGAKQAFVLNLLRVLNQPVSLGSMTLRLSGFLYALLVVLFTHTAVRLWRHVLRSRILDQSGMELGLQESIATISTYMIWLFGILVALSVLGVSATSLTVAFGALGIGLGFGLQAIFNNFLSGLILLFERPIQTGDAVEINGVWGVVKKINVRATIVQTWDNASLIIPNSEFISSQVTNWSFKDLSLRRTITVGVAYGSDTRLVRDTLLEIARKTPKVLRTPEPDVLFFDFGDSALIFRLRVWTTIKNALVLESNMRYEIDRLFRERNINIAFPQRDVHLHLPAEGTPGKGADVAPQGAVPSAGSERPIPA